ncbi:MAG: glycosyltransferase family 2 protein [Phascolarctobacterium sp.]|nr:glycosyltransferase family 2 protein [Phascolarctobacterium sp.]
MKSKDVLVSIVVPIFNDEKYIKECVESILRQSYKNIEVLLINDGSTDSSGEVCERLSKIDNRIVVYHNDNKGLSYSRNFGINNCRGKYILPVDSDDYIYNTYVEKAVEVLEANDNIGIVYCKAEYFGERKGLWELPDFTIGEMLVRNVIFATAMFRKDDWERVGGYSLEMNKGLEDYDFWLSIIELSREVFRIPEVLFKYRIKKQSMIKRLASKKDDLYEMYTILYGRHKKLYSDNQEIFFKTVIKKYIDREHLLNSIKNRIPFYNKITSFSKVRLFLKKL